MNSVQIPGSAVCLAPIIRLSRIEPIDDLPWRRKALLLMLREDHVAVDDDIEHAIVALDQRRVDAELVLDPGRQTGGLRKVVSTTAVLDRDVHR